MKQILHNSFALLIAKERRKFYFLAAMDVLISLLDIVSLAVLLFIVNLYSKPSDGMHSSIFPSGLMDNKSVLPIALFLLFFSIKNAFGYLLQKAQYRFVYNVAARLSEKKLLQYLEGTYQQYVSVDSSVHIRKISQHPIEFGHYILAGIQQIITQVVLILAALAAILWFNAGLFALLFLLLMPPVIVIAFILKKRTRAARTKTRTTSERALQYLKEGLSGYIESNIYDRHHFFTQRYAGWQRELNDQLLGLQSIQGISARLLEVFAVLGLFVLIALSKWNNHSFDVLTIGAFMAGAYKIMPGIVKVLNCSGQIRAYSFVIADLQQNENTGTGNTAEPALDSISSVDFKNVSFSYKDRLILDGFDLSVKQGEFIGISGISGSGKTTIMNLLLGFTETGSGHIFINGMNASVPVRQQYRQCIAYVKQQPFLIYDTISNNITLDEKIPDKVRLDAAVKNSGLDAFVSSYPEGLATLITENGKNISGGQRQRIVIARALYKNASLIILDEPFNELDNASEQRLLQQFRAIAATGKIVLLITHNKESLSYCNKIISLDEA